VPLPETIPVKYTEEEADYVSMRPLVRQNFRAAELVDMIVRVAGKDLARVQQILRSGSVVFQSYRYWWQGFEGDATALGGLLAAYPEADPSRPFKAESCTEVMLEASAVSRRRPIVVTRDEARRKPFWRGRSFWDRLMELAVAGRPQYREYSYGWRADVYGVLIDARQAVDLARDAGRLASRGLRPRLAALPETRQMRCICPRS